MAKYQAPEGYVLDSNTGLYYTQVIAEDAAGNKSQVVTWFNADTGEYRQDVYPVKGGANTAPPISSGAKTTASSNAPKGPSKSELKKQAKQAKLNAVPRPPKVDTSDDYQYYKNKNFMKGLGVFLIVCLILALLVIFFIRFIMGESSCTMSKEDYEELQQAKKEAVIDAFSSSGNESSTTKLTSADVNYADYDYYPQDSFSNSFIRMYKNGNFDVYQINIETIGNVSQAFPNIPAKNANMSCNYMWYLCSSDNNFEVYLDNSYDETSGAEEIYARDMKCQYRYKGDTGTALVKVDGYNLCFYDFSNGLDGDMNRDTKFVFQVYAPYWDDALTFDDFYVAVDEPYHSASMDKDKKEKQKPADLFGGLNTGTYSEDEAAMMEAAGEDYSEAPKGSAGVPNYYLGIWMDGDFNFDRASAPTMAFYENGVFEINANFLEGFCNYCGEFDVERKGSEIYLHLHDYGTANGAPATATVKFSDSNPDTCYLMDEGFGMMNYEHTAPYEFYRDTRG
jgi:hypothetical protein